MGQTIVTSCASGDVIISHEKRVVAETKVEFPIITSSGLTSINFKSGVNDLKTKSYNCCRAGDKITIKLEINIQDEWSSLETIRCPQGSGVLLLGPSENCKHCCCYGKSVQNLGLFFSGAEIKNGKMIFTYYSKCSHSFDLSHSSISFSLDTMFNPIPLNTP